MNVTLHTSKRWITHQKRGSASQVGPAMVVRLEGRKRIDMTISKMTSNKDTAGTAAACGSDRCISSAFGGIWFPPSTYLPMTFTKRGGQVTLGLNLSALKPKTTSNGPKVSCYKELIVRQYMYHSCTSRSHVYADNTF